MLQDGYKTRKGAEKFNVPITTIEGLKRGITYKYINEEDEAKEWLKENS